MVGPLAIPTTSNYTLKKTDVLYIISAKISPIILHTRPLNNSLFWNLLSEAINVQSRIIKDAQNPSYLWETDLGNMAKTSLVVYNYLHQTLQKHVSIREKYCFLHINKAGLVMATSLTYSAQRTKLQPTCLLTEHGIKPTTTGSDILNNYASKLAENTL